MLREVFFPETVKSKTINNIDSSNKKILEFKLNIKEKYQIILQILGFLVSVIYFKLR